MATPLNTRKQVVDLATPAPRVSRIRRDPPPPVKPVTAADIRERETRAIVVGVITIALAVFVLLINLNNAAGWSPSQYNIYLD